jgi:hypothetical protein
MSVSNVKKPMSLEDFVRGAATAAASDAEAANVDATPTAAVESTTAPIDDVNDTRMVPAESSPQVDAVVVDANDAVPAALPVTTPSKPKIPLSELKKSLADADVATLRQVRHSGFFFFFF